MAKLAWKPWHKVVDLRPDLKAGELSLALFAADLHDVAMGKARPVYQDPKEFFALTYPTFNLRELAKDVALRLAAKNDKTVRQLELTYGGGKTHALITLYHLVNNPAKLPDMPAVQEFVQHIGMTPPQARVAVLSFDKLDVEKGMEVRGPDGKTRWLKNPWSVIAFQLAGADGLRLLHASGKDAERDSAPAENLMIELLALPQKDRLSTLVLIDEVLMFAREKVRFDPGWRATLVNFFQYLTQAATKVDRCAIVASLLATDPRMSDTLGKEITHELYAIFRREREEGVQPVVKEDVAEILRRRFFTADSIRDREAFRPHVVAALKGISDIEEQTRKEGKAAEGRFLLSYPFHPDLTDVFYSKWTNLEGFQRTRGILRTFALALRDAEGWDECPLVGANVFLGASEKGSISEAARELTTVAATEEYEGKKQEWTGILEGELDKARQVEMEFPGLRHREVEQAVFATFLHSQPIGQKALTRELFALLGHTRPDRIELEKALRQWAERSWFLDEAAIRDAGGKPNGDRLPKAWGLGSRPNLRQMHYEACSKVSPDIIEASLLDHIGKQKNLSAGASGAGAKVHTLPDRPRDIDDDGEFRYVILGPKAVSDSGKPSAGAKRYIDEKTGPDSPRVYRNAVVIAVPSRDGLEVARNWIRDYLGWEEVRVQLKEQFKEKEIDPIRTETLNANIEVSRKRIPEAVFQAYCIAVTVSDKNEVQAFKMKVDSGEPLFNIIKADGRARIQDTAITAEALLPGGPYDLWREGETSRRVKDLVGAFAQFPHLPKMLNRKAILDTLVSGCVEGRFVLRLVRPDRSEKTFWRVTPDESSLKEPSLEVVLPESATLAEIPASLVAPKVLPGLWEASSIALGKVHEYFSGTHVVRIPRTGYEEAIAVPKADVEVVNAAVGAAVKDGKVWLTSGPASILAEDVPAGLLTPDAVLQVPPAPISASDVLPPTLPEAWVSETATAYLISVALSKKVGKTLPWVTVRDAIDGAMRARMIERAVESGPWPCDFSGAQTVKLAVPGTRPPPQQPPPIKKAGIRMADADIEPKQIQDLADVIADVRKAAAGHDLKFKLHVELGGDKPAPDAVVEKVNKLLKGVSNGLELK